MVVYGFEILDGCSEGRLEMNSIRFNFLFSGMV